MVSQFFLIRGDKLGLPGPKCTAQLNPDPKHSPEGKIHGANEMKETSCNYCKYILHNTKNSISNIFI